MRARSFAGRVVRAGLAGAAGGLVTYLSVLRAPIGQLARAAGREPSASSLAVVITVSALLAIGVGEALGWVFARAAEAKARDHDRSD